MRAFRRIRAKNAEVRLLQDSLREQFDDLQAIPFLSGRMLTVDFISGDTTIAHGLNRQPQGWHIFDITKASNIFRVSWSSTLITIHSSTAVDGVKLWVF